MLFRSLHMLAEKLQMTEEEAEKWMVEMVRNSAAGSNTADAKIDSSAKQVRQMTVMLAYRRRVYSKHWVEHPSSLGFISLVIEVGRVCACMCVRERERELSGVCRAARLTILFKE